MASSSPSGAASAAAAPAGTSAGASGGGGRQRKQKRERRRVVWDEDNLAYNEEHKTPKQKIDEPKTPYHHPEEESSDVSPGQPLSGSDTEQRMSGASTSRAAAVSAASASASHGVNPEAIRDALLEQIACRGTADGSGTDGAGSSGGDRGEAGRSRSLRGTGWTSSEDEGDNNEWMDDRSEDGRPLRTTSVSFSEEQIDYYAEREGQEDFREHRRKHYDEYRKLKLLREKGVRAAVGQEDDEDGRGDATSRAAAVAAANDGSNEVGDSFVNHVDGSSNGGHGGEDTPKYTNMEKD